VRKAADHLANTPTICRKSYVHDSIITAFEEGELARFAGKFRKSRSSALREQVLAQVITAAAA
jgi:DNA topoisomerase-1